MSKAGDKPDYAHFPDISAAWRRSIDHLNKIYGSGKHYPIYNDRVRLHHQPAAAPSTSPRTYPGDGGLLHQLGRVPELASNPRMASYMQYLLADPPATTGAYSGFASGLRLPQRQAQGRLPRLPAAGVHAQDVDLAAGQSPRCGARPGPAGSCRPTRTRPRPCRSSSSSAGTGRWTTLQTVTTAGTSTSTSRFPASGNVRLAYTYPQSDPFLPVGFAGSTVDSRTIKIT